jgi:hypothetical protein
MGFGRKNKGISPIAVWVGRPGWPVGVIGAFFSSEEGDSGERLYIVY